MIDVLSEELELRSIFSANFRSTVFLAGKRQGNSFMLLIIEIRNILMHDAVVDEDTHHDQWRQT
jgi:hypothetical protein